MAFPALPASRPGDLPRLSEGPYEVVSKVTLFPRPHTAVNFDTMAFSIFAIEVMSCRSGPGDVPVTADAYVVGGGVGAARKALVSLGYVRLGM